MAFGLTALAAKLGITVGQLIAGGISLGTTTASAVGSKRKGNEANRRRMAAKEQGDELVREAIKGIEASNTARELGITKDLFKDTIESAIVAAQQQFQGGLPKTDQTFAQTGVTQLQANLNKILESARNAASRQLLDIQEKVAGVDREIAKDIAGIRAGQANQLYQEAGDYAAQEAAYNRQFGRTIGTLGKDLATLAVPVISGKIEASAAKKGVEKAVGELGSAGYIENQLKDMKDLSTISNPALREAIMANKTLGQDLLELAKQGDNEAVTQALIDQLEYDNLQSIIKDIPGSMDPDRIYKGVFESIDEYQQSPISNTGLGSIPQ